MEEIERMQKHLLLIRRTVGWTAEELGEKIGVTRQTINNIENGRNSLTKTQYIALRSILEAEIISSPDDTQMLALLLEALIDNPDKLNAEEKEILLSKANMFAPSILLGTATRKDVSNEWIDSIKEIIAHTGIAAGTGIVAGAGIVGAGIAAGAALPLGIISGVIGGTSAWLIKINNSTKKNKKKHKK